jgi:hypothetical protein
MRLLGRAADAMIRSPRVGQLADSRMLASIVCVDLNSGKIKFNFKNCDFKRSF